MCASTWDTETERKRERKRKKLRKKPKRWKTADKSVDFTCSPVMKCMRILQRKCQSNWTECSRNSDVHNAYLHTSTYRWI